MKKKNKNPHRNKNKSRQSNTLTVTLDGWMAHQVLNKQYVWVCDNKGKLVGEFFVEEKLTEEQLKNYITYCRKYPIAEETQCQ